MCREKTIKLGATSVLILLILILTSYFALTEAERENSSDKSVQSTGEGLTTGEEKSIVAQHSHEMPGMRQESGIETQIKEKQGPSELSS